MSIELSILTLNIWGIPWISTDRELRVRAIGDQLVTGKYDIVSLQEVWSISDYDYLRERLASVLPYAHYFYSGVMGSGLALFSRYPILSTLFHTWSLNGYVHRVHHGDWFGGKGVGMARLNVHGKQVHVYLAHLHAEYDREYDDYKAHRVIQSFDTAQFIESTRGTSVFQILAGDLNTEPGDLAYRTLISVAALRDACTLPTAGTNECSDNAYTSAAAAATNSPGKRIDYLLFRLAAGWHAESDYSLPFPRELVTEAGGPRISYSDHEAVLARFRLRVDGSYTQQHPGDMLETASELDARTLYDRLHNDLSDCIHLCTETLKLLQQHRTFYWAVAAAAFAVLVTVMDVVVPYGLQYMFIWARVVLSGAVLFAVFMATLWNRMEANALLGARASMEMALQAIKGD